MTWRGVMWCVTSKNSGGGGGGGSRENSAFALAHPFTIVFFKLACALIWVSIQDIFIHGAVQTAPVQLAVLSLEFDLQ